MTDLIENLGECMKARGAGAGAASLGGHRAGHYTTGGNCLLWKAAWPRRQSMAALAPTAVPGIDCGAGAVLARGRGPPLRPLLLEARRRPGPQTPPRTHPLAFHTQHAVDLGMDIAINARIDDGLALGGERGPRQRRCRPECRADSPCERASSHAAARGDAPAHCVPRRSFPLRAPPPLDPTPVPARPTLASRRLEEHLGIQPTGGRWPLVVHGGHPVPAGRSRASCCQADDPGGWV